MECKGQWKGPTAGGAKYQSSFFMVAILEYLPHSNSIFRDCETFKNNPNVLMAVNQKGVYNVFLSQVGSDELQAIGFYILRGNETGMRIGLNEEREILNSKNSGPKRFW